MDILKNRYTITELSEELGVTDHALRYYEREFKLNIPKDERGRRYYTSEHANIMYQIKMMRDDGLQIKDIKKVLKPELVANIPPTITLDDSSFSILPVEFDNKSADIKRFFDDFKTDITNCISSEMSITKEQLSREILKSKLELGACVENSMRKLESKMEKHFQEVDSALTNWREKNKKLSFKSFFKK